MKPSPHVLRGIVLMLCAVFIFACMDATAKWLTARYSIPMLVWARYMVHCLLMLIFLLPTRGRLLWKTSRPGRQILRASMLFGVTVCMIASFRLTPLTVATATIFITPLLVGLLSGPVLGEKVAGAQGMAIVVGLAGMLLMARPGGDVPLAGFLFAVGGALCYTVYQLLTRMMASTESSVTLVFYTALTGSVISTLLLPWFGSEISPPPADLFPIAMLGVMGGSGHFLLTLAFRHAPAATLAPFVYVQLIWAGLLDLLVFGHVPEGVTWVGILLIAGAGVSVVWKERRSFTSEH